MQGRAGRAGRTVFAAVGVAAAAVLAVACGGKAAAPEVGSGGGGGAAKDTDILVVGMDGGPGRTGDRFSDTVVLVHVPAKGGAASMISLPRDTYVDVEGGGKTKLNSVYRQALDAERRTSPGADPQQLEQRAEEKLVATVQDLTGVTIEHYAQVDMAGFGSLTEAVGGVEVCLKAPTSDRYANANFTAGKQTVQGASALAFVRQRHGLPNGDLDRMRRQQAILSGLVGRISGSGVLSDPGKLNALIDTVRKYVVLDQSWDLPSFATQVRGLTQGGVRTATIPITGNAEVPDVGSVFVVDKAAVEAFVQQFSDSVAGGGSASATGSAQPAAGGPPCVR